MEYGVYTSATVEVALTKNFALIYYCNGDKTIFGTKLYYGCDYNKKIVAVCERNQIEQTTKYAYTNTDNQKITNDYNGVCKQLNENFYFDISDLKKIDDITLIPVETQIPTVAEVGIAKCLRLWRLGNTYKVKSNEMYFYMVTNKIEYVFSIQNNSTNIYCGASVNIPFDNGLFGGGQYFRLRNFADNTAPYCKFYCNIGNNITLPEVQKVECQSGTCTVTDKGIYWSVKNFSDDRIVLQGCGNDEYIYERISSKSERFKD